MCIRDRADGVDPLLRRLQDVLAAALVALHQAPDLVHGLGDPPQQGLVLDDLHVLPHVGGGRGHVDELDHVAAGALVVVGAVLAHLLQHRHRVDDLGVAEHGVHGGEQRLVVLQVEVLDLQRLYHLGDTAAVNEHTAQYCLLRLHAVGGLPVEKRFVQQNSPAFYILLVLFCVGMFGESVTPRA